MDAVLVVNVDAVVDIPQDKDHALRVFISCRNNRMKALRFLRQIAVGLDIIQQIKPELIQPQVHDGDARGHILHIHHFLLKPLQLLLAVFQVAFFFRVNQIVITSGGHHGNFHPGFHTGFQVYVFVQRHIRPEIHQLNHLVPAADTVDTPKTLDNTHRIPVNVVIDQIVAILQILTFGNAVSGDKNINLFCTARHQHIPPLRNG